MKQIFLDTETTGLESDNHRIVEIAALAYQNRKEAATFHYFCNPQREIDREAIGVHGLTAEFLADKPLFSGIAEELREFLREGEILIHNAAFDCAFLNAEFGRCNMPPLEEINPQITCTLELSRRKNAGMSRHRLEDLCKHWGVDDSERQTHNALLDVRLLAKVYFAMSREQISMEMPSAAASGAAAPAAPVILRAAGEKEIAAHEAYLDAMEKEMQKAAAAEDGNTPPPAAIWRR